MRALMSCVAALAVLAAPAAAGARYDRKLEEAVLDIVAKKMGDIRGGFSFDAKPQIVVSQDSMFTGSIGIETARLAKPVIAPANLTQADERKVSRIIVY